MVIRANERRKVRISSPVNVFKVAAERDREEEADASRTFDFCDKFNFAFKNLGPKMAAAPKEVKPLALTVELCPLEV